MSGRDSGFVMLSKRIRAMGGAHWLVLFGLILTGWMALWMMSVPAETRELSRIYGVDFWVELCLATPDISGFPKLFLMWSLMSAAMMLPTALPSFATYDDLSTQAETSFGKLVLGYLAVWIGFSALAAAAQIAFMRAGLLDGVGSSRSALFSAALLLLAGGYQFSALKDACLTQCRMPLTFFMQHWDEGPLRMGIRLGAVCLGCCWALMLLGFVGGVMSLGFMALATVIMVFEKLPDLGRYVSKPLGVILIMSALWVAVIGI